MRVPTGKGQLEFGVKLLNYLKEKGLKVFLEPKLAKYANRPKDALPLEKMKVDWIITVGGDGTILRTCLLLPKPEPPILAINMGERGFMAEVTPKEGIKALDKCLEGKFAIERCMKLASFIGDDRLPDALNEVFITSRALAKTLYAKICKNEELVARCRSDGIIVASQAGTTGYSLSAGGPILDPEIDAFVLTPVCPLSAFPPIVFPAKAVMSIELLKPKKVVVVIDGHYQAELRKKKPCITIKKSENESSFIRLKSDFYRRLKGRLLFPRGK